MDFKEIYRKFIMEILSTHANIPEANPHIQTVTVFDTYSDHYQLLRIGWRD